MVSSVSLDPIDLYTSLCASSGATLVVKCSRLASDRHLLLLTTEPRVAAHLAIAANVRCVMALLQPTICSIVSHSVAS